MDLDRPFAVITPTADGDALSVLAGAERGFTAAQVQSLAGRRSVEGMRQALKRLASQGIVTASRAGGATLYELNHDHLAAAPVIAILTMKREMIDRLRSRFESWPHPCAYAALFGSMARGEMQPTSDIDLLVVRSAGIDPDDEGWASQIEELRVAVVRWTGNDTRVLEIDEADLGAARPSVLDDVRRDGIWLAGPRDYLAGTLAAQGS